MADPFEFPSSSAAGSPAMCSADDVISHGKLLPFFAPAPPIPAKTEKTYVAAEITHDSGRLRSNSIGQRPKRWLWGGKVTAQEYRKLRRAPDPDPMRKKPRSCLLLFGSVRIPAGMEMREIRIRQERLSSSSSAAAAAEEKKEWGPWKLVRSLSCRGVEVAGDCHRHIVL